jgi:uncharacterized protein YcfJ
MTRKNLIIFAIGAIAVLAVAVTVFSIFSKNPAVEIPTDVVIVQPEKEEVRPKVAPFKTERVIGVLQD